MAIQSIIKLLIISACIDIIKLTKAQTNYKGLVDCGQTRSGSISNSGEIDYYWVRTFEQYESITIDACASLFDTHIRIESVNTGSPSMSNEDAQCGPHGKASKLAEITVETPGYYRVYIQGSNGEYGMYSFTFFCNTEPTVAPTAKPTQFLPPGYFIFLQIFCV